MSLLIQSIHPKKQVLITGAHGMLGRALIKIGQSEFPAYNIHGFGKDAFDVTDPDACKLISQRKILNEGWIIHCAALVNVELCAKDPQLARRIIVEGTQNIIHLANETHSKVFYPQSFLTYGECESDIPENFSQHPLSHYGELKLEAQELIRKQCPNSLIAIMAGFFGGEEKDKNFVGKIIPSIFKAIQNGEKTFAVGNRIWQPTWTNDLARATWNLIDAGKSGSYQMGCEGEASFFELAQEIVRILNWDRFISIVPAATDLINQAELGRRPSRAVLSSQRLKNDGLYSFNNWRVSLQQYLSHPFFDQYKYFQGSHDELCRA